MQSLFKIPTLAAMSGDFSLKKAQVMHRLRWVGQQISPPSIAIVGGYTFGNLGDMALGYSVSKRVVAKGLHCGLQTLYSLNRWPKAEYVIVGGGCLYKEDFRQLSALYGDDPKRVAVIGVDFNDPLAVQQNIGFFNQVAAITCRSAEMAKELQYMLGRKDITSHQDLSFSLYEDTSTNNMDKSGSKPVYGINCVPFFLKQFRGRFVPGTSYFPEMQRDTPELIPYIDRLGEWYSQLVRAVCINAMRKGMHVVHFPFEPIDNVFAQTILNDLKVEFMPYSTNVNRVILQIGKCEHFFTSRFHSLVFSILKHRRITPFCYATKCNRLITDLQINRPSVIYVDDLIRHKNKLAERVIENEGICVLADTVKRAFNETTAKIDSAIDKLIALNGR